MKNDLLTTLSIGIDVSAKTNVVCALDFRGNVIFRSSAPNSLPGAENILKDILTNLNSNDFKSVTIALESTSYYSLHLTNFLSTSEDLLPFHPIVYNLNPKNTSNYKKSFTDMDKTDPNDAFVIADYVRIGRVNINLGKALISLLCSV